MADAAARACRPRRTVAGVRPADKPRRTGLPARGDPVLLRAVRRSPASGEGVPGRMFRGRLLRPARLLFAGPAVPGHRRGDSRPGGRGGRLADRAVPGDHAAAAERARAPPGASQASAATAAMAAGSWRGYWPGGADRLRGTAICADCPRAPEPGRIPLRGSAAAGPGTAG